MFMVVSQSLKCSAHGISCPTWIVPVLFRSRVWGTVDDLLLSLHDFHFKGSPLLNLLSLSLILHCALVSFPLPPLSCQVGAATTFSYQPPLCRTSSLAQ